jgi:hypothetical protein
MSKERCRGEESEWTTPSRLFLFFQARLFSLILTGLLSLGILVDGKMSMSLLFKRGTTQRRTCLAKQVKVDAALSRITQSTDTTIRSCFVLLHIRG